MALTESDVARLADLARIDLNAEELAAFAPQLDVILDAVASVARVSTDDIPPTSHALGLTNVFRSDEVTPGLTPDEALAMAPVSEEGRFRVPRILDEE